MEIKVLGGACRIGGNRILVKSGQSYFWLDMGATHEYKLDLYNYAMVRNFSLKRLVSEEVFPKEAVLQSTKEEGATKYINLILSHAHSDHYGLLTYYRAWQEAGISIRLFAPKDLYKVLKARLELGNLKAVLSNIDVRNVNEADVEQFNIKPVRVDHSIDASYAYMIEAPDVNLAYTGDYRFTTDKDFDIMKKQLEGTDILITEATRVAAYNLLTEDQVKEQAEEVMNRYWDSTVIFVVGWYTHTRRVRSIIESAGGRKVVLHSKIASLISAADEKFLNSPHVYVLQMREREGIPEGAKTMSLQEVNDERGNVVVVIPDAQKIYMWREETPESILVRPKDIVLASLSEPYDEDSTQSLIELSDYVMRQLKVPIYHIHASGHAKLHEIANLVNECKPKKVIVVHSQVPEALTPLIQKGIEVETPGT